MSHAFYQIPDDDFIVNQKFFYINKLVDQYIQYYHIFWKPILQLDNFLKPITDASNIHIKPTVLLLATGFLVNGPYALITTAVSANLGQHPSLEGRCKALSTVICIIDGTGSFGAVLGPLLTSLISPYGWIRVFQMLIVSDLLALLVSVYIHYRLVNRTNTGGLMRLKFSFLRIDLKFFLATLIVLCFFITFYLATI